MFLLSFSFAIKRLPVLIFLAVLPLSSAQADSVATSINDTQVKKLVSTYEQFFAAANNGNEPLVRRLLAGNSTGLIDNCIRDEGCRKNNGGNFIGMVKKQIERGIYPSLHGGIPWKFVEGRWNTRSGRLVWQAEQVVGQERSIYFLAVHLILTDKGWKVFKANSVINRMPIDTKTGDTMEHFLGESRNQLVP